MITGAAQVPGEGSLGKKLTAPRCSFHVSVEMVPLVLKLPSGAYGRGTSKGVKGTHTVQLSDEEIDLCKKTYWRCPIAGCCRVSSRFENRQGRKCKDCGVNPVDESYHGGRCHACFNLKINGRTKRSRANGTADSKSRSLAALGMTVVLLLLLALPANAGPLSPFKFVGKTVGRTFSNFITWRDPARNLLYLGYAASIALDLHSTSYFVAHCADCIEVGNPLLPRRPSNRALALDGAGEFLFTTTLSTAILENRHIPKPFKFIPYAGLGAFAAGHSEAAHANYQVPKLHATPVQPAEPAR